MIVADTVFPPDQVAEVRLTADTKLIRAGLLMLLFMTAAFDAATWSNMQDLAIEVKAVPLVLFAIVCLLVARLYPKVDEIAGVQRTAACAVEPLLALHMAELAQVPLETRDEIWKYWDTNGTGRGNIESVKNNYGVPANAVQHLLEAYDVRWRKQVAILYGDNAGNENTAHVRMDLNQIAGDALRLKSGLPIYPVAGVWLCSDCCKRPCQCNLVTSKR